MKFRDLYNLAAGLARRDGENIFAANTHLSEEVGEFSAALRCEYGLKDQVPEAAVYEAADILLCLIEVLTLHDISYDEFKAAAEKKLAKWEKKKSIIQEEETRG